MLHLLKGPVKGQSTERWRQRKKEKVNICPASCKIQTHDLMIASRAHYRNATTVAQNCLFIRPQNFGIKKHIFSQKPHFWKKDKNFERKKISGRFCPEASDRWLIIPCLSGGRRVFPDLLDSRLFGPAAPVEWSKKSSPGHFRRV